MIKFYIEFGGFYDSWHSDAIDNKIESEIKDIEDDIDWEKTHELYARNYLEVLSRELGMKLKYISLWKPKYYNFETDEICAEITVAQYKKIREEIFRDVDIINWIEEASKSRDGFTSFYSGFAKVSEDDEILLRYYFKYLHRNTQDVLLRISETEVELVEYDTIKSIKN